MGCQHHCQFWNSSTTHSCSYGCTNTPTNPCSYSSTNTPTNSTPTNQPSNTPTNPTTYKSTSMQYSQQDYMYH
jgi:hypothetical protein